MIGEGKQTKRALAIDTFGAWAQEGLAVLTEVARLWGCRNDIGEAQAKQQLFATIGYTLARGVANLLLSSSALDSSPEHVPGPQVVAADAQRPPQTTPAALPSPACTTTAPPRRHRPR